MKTLCLDMTAISAGFSIFIRDAKLIPAGTTIAFMPVSDKNVKYQRFAAKYDIHFLFADDLPALDFYSVPRLDVFARDSRGGYLASLETPVDFESDGKIIYVDARLHCFLAGENGRTFLENSTHWQKECISFDGVSLFSSLAEAKKHYDFLDPESIKMD